MVGDGSHFDIPGPYFPNRKEPGEREEGMSQDVTRTTKDSL